MAKFILLIYEDEAAGPKPPSPEWLELWDAYVALDDEAKAAGVLIDSQPVQPSTAAVTVRSRAGLTSTSSGPVANTPDQLTGYYLLECADIGEATAWATRIPAAATGSVEVRPLLEGPASP